MTVIYLRLYSLELKGPKTLVILIKIILIYKLLLTYVVSWVVSSRHAFSQLHVSLPETEVFVI